MTSNSKVLTGKHVALGLIAFFAVIVVVNITFIYAAVGSFRGEDVKGSYRTGLNYNETLEERRKQSALGWQASVEITQVDQGRELRVRLMDARGHAIRGSQITGRLRHPIDTSLDIPLSFTTSMPSTAILPVSVGRWTLEASAEKGENTFTFRKDIALK